MAAQRNRIFTCLGCAVVGPLGCAAFLAGGMVVGVWATPLLVAPSAAGWLSERFEETCEGRVDVGEVRLSWTGQQSVRGVVVRDPEGAEVLAARMDFPSLWRLLSDGELGEIALELSLDLALDADGGSNLGRALTSRSGDEFQLDLPEREELLSGLFERAGTLSVSAPRLVVARPEAPTLSVTGASAALAFGPGVPLVLTAAGSLGAGRFRLDGEVAPAALSPEVGDPGATATLSAEAVPADALAALGLGELARVLGAREVDLTVSLEAARDGAAPFALRAEGGAASAAVSGRLVSTGLAASAPRLSLELDLLLAGVESSGLVPPVRVLGRELRVGWPGRAELRGRGLVLALEEGGAALSTADGGASLELPSPTVVDLPGAAGLPLFGARLTVEPPDGQGRRRLALVASFDAQGESRLEAAIVSERPLDALAGAPVDFALRVRAAGVPLAGLALAGAVDGVGPEAELALDLELVDGEPRPFSLTLLAPPAELVVAGTVAGPAAPLPELLRRAAFELDTRGWSSGARAAGLSAERPDVHAAWSAAAGLVLTASEARFAFADGAPAGSGLALRDVAVRAAPGAERIEVTASLEEGGSFEAAFAPGALRSAAAGRDVEVRLRGASAAALDRELGARGVVAAVFGPSLSLDVVQTAAPDGQRVEAEARSSRAVAALAAVRGEGRLRAGRLDLDAALDEGSVAAVVRPLLPLAADVEPAADGARLALLLTELEVPVDGLALAPGALSARAALSLGDARVALAPALRTGFSLEPAPADAPLVVALAGGRAHLEQLVLPGSGGDVRLSGGWGPGGRGADLWTEIPLRRLGADVSPVLHAARELLQPDLQVPVVVAGDAPDFRLAVRPQWLRTVTDVLGGVVPDFVKDNLRRLLPEQGQ